MLSYRVIVCASNDAGLLVEARLSNEHITAARSVALNTFGLRRNEAATSAGDLDLYWTVRASMCVRR